MNTHNDSRSVQGNATRAGRRWPIALALALALGAGASFASGWPDMHGHHGHAAMTPAAMDAHIDKMVEQCAGDGSADQKSRLAAIAKSAVADLAPAHEQLREGHARAHALLAAPTIDRAALEQLRVAQMQRMDLISKRLLAAAEEGAEVLTPEQRARCGVRLGALMH